MVGLAHARVHAQRSAHAHTHARTHTGLSRLVRERVVRRGRQE